MPTLKRETGPEGWREGFRCANLPKAVFDTLRLIARAHGASQRQVVVAGVVALSHLSQTDPAGLAKVWEQTRELCPAARGGVTPVGNTPDHTPPDESPAAA